MNKTFNTRLNKLQELLNPLIDEAVIIVNKNKGETIEKKFAKKEKELKGKINRKN